MKNKRHGKKMYEPPRIMEVLGVASWLLAGSAPRGIPTPGEDQGPDGGGMAKSNSWDIWNTDDLDDNKTSKHSNPWGED